jgi:SsrA-binding protein
MKAMKILSENKKAYFTYQILEKFEAGISLNGQEVKSIKLGRINLMGSYVVVRNGEVYLVGANVPPYQPKNAPADYDPQRSRKLLLRKKEIDYLFGKSQQKGLTMVPLKVYTNNAKIKLEFGIGKGKKKFDKRETIKKRETEREMKKELKMRG